MIAAYGYTRGLCKGRPLCPLVVLLTG